MKRSQALKVISKELQNITYNNLADKYSEIILKKIEELGYLPTAEEKLQGDTLRLLIDYDAE